MSTASSARVAATTAEQPAAATLMLTPLKGRGTAWAIEHRFSSQARDDFDDGWGTLDQAALEERQAPGTQIILERQIKPWAMGRKAWMFVGSELAGQRATMVMSLVQSAKLHGHDPWAYLRDVLQRLPTQLNSRIEELLPHRWQASK